MRTPSPLGLPYCPHCLGMGCYSCGMVSVETARKVQIVDGFLEAHLKGARLHIDTKEQLMEILYAAILFGRDQVKKEGSRKSLPDPPKQDFDRFANLEYLPVKKDPEEEKL